MSLNQDKGLWFQWAVSGTPNIVLIGGSPHEHCNWFIGSSGVARAFPGGRPKWGRKLETFEENFKKLVEIWGKDEEIWTLAHSGQWGWLRPWLDPDPRCGFNVVSHELRRACRLRECGRIALLDWNSRTVPEHCSMCSALFCTLSIGIFMKCNLRWTNFACFGHLSQLFLTQFPLTKCHIKNKMYISELFTAVGLFQTAGFKTTKKLSVSSIHFYHILINDAGRSLCWCILCAHCA